MYDRHAELEPAISITTNRVGQFTREKEVIPNPRKARIRNSFGVPIPFSIRKKTKSLKKEYRT
jgi:hypothetical protein